MNDDDVGAVIPSREMLPAAGGVSLYRQLWVPSGLRKSLVVLVHGLKDHSQRYAPVAVRLSARGFIVGAYDLRGHGRSGGTRAYVHAFREHLDDLQTVLDDLRHRYPTAPVVLFGHSMGGAIVAEYFLERRPSIAGLALSAPALKPPTSVGRFAVAATKFLGSVAPRSAILKLPNADFSSDPAVVAAMDRDPLIYQAPAPARTAAELLRAMERIRRRAEEFSSPFLVMHGTADRLSNPEGSRELHTRARSTDKTLSLFDGAFHDLLHEPQGDRVFGTLADWLEAHRGLPAPDPHPP